MLNNSNIINRRSPSPAGAGATTTAHINSSRACSRRDLPSSQSPSHSFLQSPTHARSNSASSTYPSSLSHSGPKGASPTIPTRIPSPEPFSPTLLSFASGYNPHQLTSSATTIAKPIAIYPQEHPQLKRFSPRFSASGASYTTYSTALASTFHQQQQIQQQQQKQQQQRRSHHHDSLDKHGYYGSDQSANYGLNNQLISRNQYSNNRNNYNSPPSSCVAIDASSCRCTWQQNLHASSVSASNTSKNCAFSATSALSEDPSVASATSMIHCSPILSHAITALLPDVVQIRQSGNNKIDSRNLIDPGSLLDGSISLPSSGASSTRTSSVSSPSPSPARSSRTSSMASISSSSSLLAENIECGYFFDPCDSSPSPSPPLPLQFQLNEIENQMHLHQQQRQQQRQQRQQSRRRHARQALPAQCEGDQGAYLIDSRHASLMQATSALTATSSGFHQNSSHNNHHHRHHTNHFSKSLVQTSSQPPPSSSQAIALSSSRYIRFLWLPLLPLLILAVGGQTSAKFESPVTYTV